MQFLRDKFKSKNNDLMNFIESTGANIILYYTHPLLKHINDKMEDEKNRVLGFYEPTCDIIFINPFALTLRTKELARVVLHELGHWTGHKNRLNRPTMDKNSRRIGTEEVVAESCFFYLSKNFGIDQDWAMKQTANYVKLYSEWYPKLNSRMGYDEGLKASEYLLNLTKK